MKGFNVRGVAVDVNSVIDESISLVRPVAREKGINIELEVESALTAWADLEMTQLIVRNLLTNAIKFTPHGKRVRVTAFRRMDRVVIRVANEGEPIPQAVMEKLFTFQSRSLQGTANEAGTGLGLAMSQQFALLNDGDITLEPRVDDYNTFTLTLPLNA